MKNISILISFIGFLGVALGAFGAHALKNHLQRAEMTSVWETAVLYQLIHVVAAWAVLARNPLNSWHSRATWSWLAGIVLFSGSLYALALGGPGWIGPITPVGGGWLLFGWFAAGRGEWVRLKN